MNFDIVRILTEHDTSSSSSSSLSFSNESSLSPLQIAQSEQLLEACFNQNTDQVQTMLSKDININFIGKTEGVTKGWTALTLSVSNEDVSTVNEYFVIFFEILIFNFDFFILIFYSLF